MRYAVIFHYPECDMESEVVVFTTMAPRSALSDALERAKEFYREQHFRNRFDHAYWVCKKVTELIGGTWDFVAGNYIKTDLEEPEGHK